MLDHIVRKKLQRQRARQARYRARLHRGVVIWHIEVTAERFERLRRLGYVRDATDGREGAAALAALIDAIEC